jgi:signal-transduction protein with cAMP-binding, CBS, and nucleotidyltransferase domain
MTMDKSQMKKFVTAIELFKGLDELEVETLVGKLVQKEYKAGDFLFKENTRRESIFIIEKRTC